MKPGAPMQECEKIKNGLINNGFQINEIVGVNMTILGVIGDTSTLDINLLRVNDWVEKVMRVQEPFKRANRMFHPEDRLPVCRNNIIHTNQSFGAQYIVDP